MPPSVVQILYQDNSLVAVDKPSGWMVHPTPLDRDAETCLETLRDRLGHHVHPVHRLDRGTSGVLLFGLDHETTSKLGELMRNGALSKRYLALVRGHPADEGEFDRPIDDQASLTRYRVIGRAELPVAVTRHHPTTRYSLIDVKTLTGRRHQIRRHLVAANYPIIGDTTYGDGRHNKFFRERFSANRLMLHATELDLIHPISGERIAVRARPSGDFARVCAELGWTVE